MHRNIAYHCKFSHWTRFNIEYIYPKENKNFLKKNEENFIYEEISEKNSHRKDHMNNKGDKVLRKFV